MRTALITWNFPPWPSGLATAAGEIAESLVLTGADVTVFDMGRSDRLVDGRLTVVGCAMPEAGRLARLRLWGGAGHLAAPLAFRNAILAEERGRPFDVVEATNWYAPAALIGGRSRAAIVTRNSTPAAFTRDEPATVRDRLDATVADRLERRQVRSSHGLISNTAEHARRVTAEYGLRDDGTPHAVIGLSLPPEMIERGRAAPYPDADGQGPIRLLFVGRAEHRKGFDALLAAMELLAPEADAGGLPSFELRLAGIDGPSMPVDVSASAGRRIRPLGALTPEALLAEYAGAHVVVAPSRYESFGLVYQEGIAFGRPMVASNEDASARAFVGAVGAGSMAAGTTGPFLAEAIRPLLADPGLRQRLRARALAAAGRFDRATLGRETLALYEQAIRRAQAR